MLYAKAPSVPVVAIKNTIDTKAFITNAIVTFCDSVSSNASIELTAPATFKKKQIVFTFHCYVYWLFPPSSYFSPLFHSALFFITISCGFSAGLIVLVCCDTIANLPPLLRFPVGPSSHSSPSFSHIPHMGHFSNSE